MRDDDLVSTTDVRTNLANLINRACYGHERIRIGRHGRPVAALIGADDLELLEALEEARDAADYDRAKVADRGERVPIDDLLAEVGESAATRDRRRNRGPAA